MAPLKDPVLEIEHRALGSRAIPPKMRLESPSPAAVGQVGVEASDPAIVERKHVRPHGFDQGSAACGYACGPVPVAVGCSAAVGRCRCRRPLARMHAGRSGGRRARGVQTSTTVACSGRGDGEGVSSGHVDAEWRPACCDFGTSATRWSRVLLDMFRTRLLMGAREQFARFRTKMS
jgi:hypothetical protein